MRKNLNNPSLIPAAVNYVAPAVETVEVAVECGFGASDLGDGGEIGDPE